jgi:hypothetical protein
MPRKKNSTGIILGLLIALALVSTYAIGSGLGWWAAEVATAETQTTVYVYDAYNNVAVDSDDHEIYRYKVDTSNLTQDEIDDLVFADYTYDTAFDSGTAYTPAADYMYALKVNGSDIVEQWKEDVQVGIVNFYVANMTEDVALAAVSVDELATGIVNTTYDEWNIYTQTLDGAEGTGSATVKEGYIAYDDFEDDAWNTVVIKISFNTTAVASYVDLKTDVEHDTLVSGNDVYFEIKTTIMGQDIFKIDFSSAVGLNAGATVSCAGVGVGYGSGASYTAWDSYTQVAA